MILDHVAIGVRSIDEAVKRFESVLGYRRATEVVVNTRQRVEVTFLEKSGSLPLKLIAPSGPDSPLRAFVARGGGLHHLCFRCESMDAELVRLRELGVRLLQGPEPGEAFENEKIAFVYAGDGLNLELIDTDRRAARIRPGRSGAEVP